MTVNFCDTCGHQFSDICGGCETLEGVPVQYSEKLMENKEKFEEGKSLPPPLGLQPRYIHDGLRLEDIINAMERYSKASMHIPVEWIVELRDLADELIGVEDARRTNTICH